MLGCTCWHLNERQTILLASKLFSQMLQKGRLANTSPPGYQDVAAAADGIECIFCLTYSANKSCNLIHASPP